MRTRNKHYVSEIDCFLEELRQSLPESDSQCRERKEYEQLNRLRDRAESDHV